MIIKTAGHTSAVFLMGSKEVVKGVIDVGERMNPSSIEYVSHNNTDTKNVLVVTLRSRRMT